MRDRLFEPVDGASIAVFRAALGAVLVWQVLSYLRGDWIAELFIRPTFHFTYPGLGWVRPWPGDGMYLHFSALLLAAFGVLLGVGWPWTPALFGLGFAQILLIDSARYQNHFYLIVLLCLCLAPSSGRGPAPRWALWLLRFQAAIPYFFGALAKLNGDWLRGVPISGWVPGGAQASVGLFFAWGGLALDALVVPGLLWRRTRPWAFAAACFFHLANAFLFQIGVFPWLMLGATTLFLEPDWPRKLLKTKPSPLPAPAPPSAPRRDLILAGLAAWAAFQLLFPLRQYAWPGRTSWTMAGDRFAWRMMLNERSARARFKVTPASGRALEVDPGSWLSRRQAEEMAYDPDMVLQFAHHLAKAYSEGGAAAKVTADVQERWNGREAARLVDPDVDLAAEPRRLGGYRWVLRSPD